MTINILSYLPSLDKLDAATLVFRTIRTGFPTALIVVWYNGNPDLVEYAYARIIEYGLKDEVAFLTLQEKESHARWIETLVLSSKDPFFICDTDVIFWDKINIPSPLGAVSGFQVPAFKDPYTGCTTVSRIHPSLMYIDPRKVKAEIAHATKDLKITRLNPLINLYAPFTLPSGLFYDCCAMLTQAVSSEPFPKEVLAKYEHLNCATYVDEVESTLPGMTALHKAVYADISAAKGLRAQQEKFYQQHAIR